MSSFDEDEDAIDKEYFKSVKIKSTNSNKENKKSLKKRKIER
jgi:hypothetical protein